MIEVIPPSSAVKIGKEIDGTVIQVCLHGESIQYQCSWWDGRSRRLEWLEEFEVSPSPDSKPVPIGFKP
jgi:hypothetical protein